MVVCGIAARSPCVVGLASRRLARLSGAERLSTRAPSTLARVRRDAVTRDPRRNEVAFDAGIDYKKNKDKLEALVVVMPSKFQSLCDFDKDIAQEVDEALNAYWTDGYGTLPVVILKNTIENGKYVKNTFRQTFYFENGNCIIDGGDGNNYYFVKSDGKC